MESEDLIHWTRAVPTFFAHRQDDQIYGHRGFAYQGMYVGMRWVFQLGISKRHASYVELDCSRDGRIWTRVGTGQPFMDYNPRRDTWDATIMRPIAMFEVGDEVWVYYFGAATELETANPDYPKSAPREWALGLATLPRDRFVSINGASAAGTLTTRPLHFSGAKLWINADAGEDGTITVAVLNRDGKPLDGMDHGDCRPIKGDSLDVSVHWKSGSDLQKLGDDGVRLQFRLRDAKLFSFWIGSN